MHHLRNVWVNEMAKAVSEFMSTFLQDSLESITPSLRISPALEQVIRAFHKEFSLTANYPKGRGELFRTLLIKHHSMEFLMHTKEYSRHLSS